MMPNSPFAENTTSVLIVSSCLCCSEKPNFSFVNFTAGFAFLPFLWAINAVWFFSDAFKKPHFEEQAQIRKCNLTNI